MEITIPQWIVDLLVWFSHLFTSAEWKAMALTVGVTLSGTHTAKIAWRLSPLHGCGGGCVNLIAAVIGFLASFFLWPQEQVPWWIAGVIAGPLAIGTFKTSFFLLRLLCPKCAALLNVDRRREDVPVDDERRKS